MSVEEIESSLCDWLVLSCSLLRCDGESLAKGLVQTHKVTSLQSLRDLLDNSADFLSTQCGLALAYTLQIQKQLRLLVVKDLETLSPAEVSTVLRNLSFGAVFCQAIARCGISGYVLTSASAADVVKQCSFGSEETNALIFSSVVKRLAKDGVTSDMLLTPPTSSIAQTTDTNTIPQVFHSNTINTIPTKVTHSSVVSVNSQIGNGVVSYSAPPLVRERKRGQQPPLISASQPSHGSTFMSCAKVKPCPNNNDLSSADSAATMSVEEGDSVVDSSSNASPTSPPPAVQQGTHKLSAGGPPVDRTHFRSLALDTNKLGGLEGRETGLQANTLKVAPVSPRSAAASAAPSLIVSHHDTKKVSIKIEALSDVTETVEPAAKKTRRNGGAGGRRINSKIALSKEETTAVGQLQQLTARVLGGDVRAQLEGLKAFIKLFPMICAQVKRAQEFGLVKRIFDLTAAEAASEEPAANKQDVIHLCFVALSHLVTSRDPTIRHYVFELGLSKVLVTTMPHAATPLSTKEFCMWLVGNYVCDAPYRKALLEDGLIQAVVEVFTETSTTSMQTKTMQSTANLLRTRPALSVSEFRPLLPIVVRNLRGDDCRCVTDSLAALYFITQEEQADCIDELFSLPGVVKKVVQLASSDSVTVCAAAEKVVENLSAGSVEQTKTLMTLNILPGLRALVTSDQRKHRQRMLTACRTVCNICGADEEVIEQVVAAGILEAIIALCAFEVEHTIQVVVFAVCYAVHGANERQITAIVKAGSLPLLCRYLQDFGDDKTTLEILAALVNILEKSENVASFDSVIRTVYDCKGWVDVDTLRDDSSPLISAAAKKINIQQLREVFVNKSKRVK